MTDKICISPSSMVSLWKTIKFMLQYNRQHISTVLEYLSSSAIMGGCVPLNETIELGKIIGVIDINDEIVCLTNKLEASFDEVLEFEEPNEKVFRTIIKIYFEKRPVLWLLYYNPDCEIFKNFIPSRWVEILEYAMLFEFDDEDVRAWWLGVIESREKFSDSIKKKIGDIGEKLTHQFEILRLEKDSIIHPAAYVRFASKFDNSLGFDILSIEGEKYSSFSESKYNKIKIEVKSSAFNDLSKFRFKLSRNEWNTALEEIKSYYFYLWAGIDIRNEVAEYGPFVIPAEKIINYVPRDQHKNCEWSECRFNININEII